MILWFTYWFVSTGLNCKIDNEWNVRKSNTQCIQKSTDIILLTSGDGTAHFICIVKHSIVIDNSALYRIQ